MSELSERLLAATSKPSAHPALLALEDGTVFRGVACGALGEVFGEVCFNTSLEGYLEVVTDPSYAGQIVVMTYPQIGNYGVCLEDAQAAHPALRGLVVRDMCYTPSNWRSELSLPEYLQREGVVAVEGVDTRALVSKVREQGACKAAISTEEADAARLVQRVRESADIVSVNLVAGVSCAEPYAFSANDLPAGKSFALAGPARARHRVVAYDCGVKRSILEGLARAGCAVTVVPWNTPADDVLALAPDGVFLSNGPGDPNAVSGTYLQVERLLGRVPVFGICMGHQMICKAAGARMEKLKFGHHGGNQPVMNLLTGRVEITAQNHGFNVAFESLGAPGNESKNESLDCHSTHFRGSEWDTRAFPENESNDSQATHSWAGERPAPIVVNERFGRIQLTHVNLNDNTPEGIAFLDIPAFSVQYHPEASPGPSDSHYLFQAFSRLMDGRDDYLDIDIARDRLEGWRF